VARRGSTVPDVPVSRSSVRVALPTCRPALGRGALRASPVFWLPMTAASFAPATLKKPLAATGRPHHTAGIATRIGDRGHRRRSEALAVPSCAPRTTTASAATRAGRSVTEHCISRSLRWSAIRCARLRRWCRVWRRGSRRRAMPRPARDSWSTRGRRRPAAPSRPGRGAPCHGYLLWRSGWLPRTFAPVLSGRCGFLAPSRRVLSGERRSRYDAARPGRAGR
jgi:hypothetical protein